jgi:hypothetical protein
MVSQPERATELILTAARATVSGDVSGPPPSTSPRRELRACELPPNAGHLRCGSVILVWAVVEGLEGDRRVYRKAGSDMAAKCEGAGSRGVRQAPVAMAGSAHRLSGTC